MSSFFLFHNLNLEHKHISFYFSISSMFQTIAVDNLSTSKNALKFKFSEKVFLTFNRVFNTFNRVFDNFSLKNQFKTLAFTVLTQKCCDFIWFQPLFLISTDFSTAFCWKGWKLLNRLVELFFYSNSENSQNSPQYFVIVIFFQLIL